MRLLQVVAKESKFGGFEELNLGWMMMRVKKMRSFEEHHHHQHLVQLHHLLLWLCVGIFLCGTVCCDYTNVTDKYLIACGSANNVTISVDRVFAADNVPNSHASGGISGSTTVGNAALSFPNLLNQARFFTTNSTYTFSVSTGRHWVRLYFYPFAYTNFAPNNSRFGVTLNEFVLLDNFSSVAYTNASNPYIMMEFMVNVTSSKGLVLSFLPANNSYAFINAIEVVSMPDDLLLDDGVLLGNGAAEVLGLGASALQAMYHINVGGATITQENDSQNIDRQWTPDDSYIQFAATGMLAYVTPQSITYPSTVPSYIAPPAVYATARTLGDSNTVNSQFNVTWVLQVESGHTYFVRLHFCEIVYSVISERVFNVYINNQTALRDFDVIAQAGKGNTPIYQDFIVSMFKSGMDKIWIQMGTSTAATNNKDAILNGMEVYKVNNTANSLAGPNPSVVATNPSPNSASTTQSSSSKSNVGIIAGVVVGGVVGLIAAVAAICYFCPCKSIKKTKKPVAAPAWLPLPLHGGSTDNSKVSTGSGKSGKSGAGSYGSSAPSNLGRYFTLAELEEATHNFDESRVLGVGGFGKVYRGEIDDGSKVAVKRGSARSEQGMNEFQTEIELLSKLRHRHLVSLIGYCEEHNEMILVYDYMANGPLRGHLYGTDAPTLSWKERLEICIGAARGLHYLHTGSSQGIIHRDVKTTNILLDENLVAKVADFGLSKIGPALEQTHVSTAVKGSFGYLDPEYFRRQQLTEKSDVYSFGVVLMEVLCARPAINPALPREQVNMAEWAIKFQKAGILDQIVDPKLQGSISPDSLKKFGDTTEKCLEERGIDRPAMGDVLWNLEYALQLQEASTGGSIERSLESPISIGTFNISLDDSSSQISIPPTLTGAGILDTSHSISTEHQSLTETSSEEHAGDVFSQLVNPQGR